MRKLIITGIMIFSFGLSFSAFADLALAKKSNCLACHMVDKPFVGPAYRDVAKKYAGDEGAEKRLIYKVRHGGGGVWGNIPMPANPLVVTDEDIKSLVRWILSGAPD